MEVVICGAFAGWCVRELEWTGVGVRGVGGGGSRGRSRRDNGLLTYGAVLPSQNIAAQSETEILSL